VWVTKFHTHIPGFEAKTFQTLTGRHTDCDNGQISVRRIKEIFLTKGIREKTIFLEQRDICVRRNVPECFHRKTETKNIIGGEEKEKLFPLSVTLNQRGNRGVKQTS
jgi:hypothetical protein